MNKKIIVAYIPVIHQGYRQFFESNPDYHTLYILGENTVNNFRPIQKDIRALKPAYAKQALFVWNLLDTIEVISLEQLKALNSSEYDLLMPDEDICRDLAEQYLDKPSVTFYPIFLRWDRRSSNAKDPIQPHLIISSDELDQQLIHTAQDEAFKSSDIWRRVGALIARNGKIINKAYNQATPHAHSSWMNGDPRNNYNKGVGIEMSTFMHAEAQLIAEAAHKGTRLAGTDMYVTTFPCPPCAMLIANAGIKRLFFAEGYAVLDGKKVLESKEVKIIKVETVLKADNPAVFVTYPEK